MNPEAEALKHRTKQFALDVLRFVRTLPSTDESRDIARQLRRAATGVGANYRATCRSRSRAEFISRIHQALEEADESGFWLEILLEAGISHEKRVEQLADECDQLCAILSSSSITAQESERRGDPDPRLARRGGAGSGSKSGRLR